MLLDAAKMPGYLLAAVFICGIPHVYPATKGQRVRSSPDIPVTQFSCTGRPPGYYADLETGCQVYHMCTEGGNQFSYRCPNTTLFQQRMLICAHWYQVNCSRSEQHYAANLLIGQRDKPFVNDDTTTLAREKQVKTLQNPDALQNLGGLRQDFSNRLGKAQSSKVVPTNTVFTNNFQNKRDGESFTGFTGNPNQASDSFPSTPFPFNSGTTEDLSSLPLAGSILPGGIKSFQFKRPQQQGFLFNGKSVQTNPTSQQPTSTPGVGFTSSPRFPTQRFSQPVSFTTTQSTPINRVDLFATTASSFQPKYFSSNTNNFQPSGFKKQPFTANSFSVSSTSHPSSQTDESQPSDLAVASQESFLGRRTTLTTTTTTTTEIPETGFEAAPLPETDVKADIQQTKNGSFPDDKYNSFIKRFNPYDESPITTDPPTTTTEAQRNTEPDQEYHTFLNRFNPYEGKSAPQNIQREQPEPHAFINRFILTSDELKSEKNRQSVDNLHNILPPNDQQTVSFPSFDLNPPLDDSDDSESNKIELHLQDPRSSLFIPSGEGSDFSKADAAPIIVTIPLPSHQNSPPMWFRTSESSDPCARCHPSFLINKNTCTPCVIVR